TELESAEAERQVMVDLRRQALFGIIARSAGGIRREGLVLKATEQFVNGLVFGLALQVPQGRLNAVDHADAEAAAAPEVLALVHPLPELRYVLHIASQQNRSEVGDRRRMQLGAAIAVVRLAQADQPRVGVNFNEGGTAVLAALAQKRIVGTGPGEQ